MLRLLREANFDYHAARRGAPTTGAYAALLPSLFRLRLTATVEQSSSWCGLLADFEAVDFGFGI